MFYEKHFTHNTQLPFNEHKTPLHLIIYEGKPCAFARKSLYLQIFQNREAVRLCSFPSPLERYNACLT